MIINNFLKTFVIIYLILTCIGYLNVNKVEAQTACQNPGVVIVNPDTNQCESPPSVQQCNPGQAVNITKTEVGGTAFCTCTCESGTPTPGPTPSPTPGQPGDPVLPTPEGSADESFIHSWATNILYGMIVFGFLYALVMAPYIGYLFALSTPDSLKKGKELLMALIYGLLLLALSSSIVGIVGSDILQV